MAAKGCPVSSTRGAQVLPSHPRLTCGFTSRLLTCVVLVTLLTEEQTCVCVCSFKNKKKKNINTSTQWQQSCDYKVNAVPPVGLLESSVFFKLPRRIFTAPFPLVWRPGGHARGVISRPPDTDILVDLPPCMVLLPSPLVIQCRLGCSAVWS